MSLDETQLNVLSMSGTPFVHSIDASRFLILYQETTRIREQNQAYPQEWASSARNAPPGQHDHERDAPHRRRSCPGRWGAVRRGLDSPHCDVSFGPAWAALIRSPLPRTSPHNCF